MLAWATPSYAARVAPIVHTYRSGETGLFVNSYLVEGDDGVVAVDAPLLLSDGRAFRARSTRSGSRSSACWSHPHPDHYNTITDVLAGEDVPVIAHRDVDREIRASDDAKRAQWGPMFGEVAGQRDVPEPDGGGRGVGRTRRPAVHRLGLRPCESASETVCCWMAARSPSSATWPSTARTPTWPTGTEPWLRAIDRAEEALTGVRTLYVGHGAPAVPAVLADQRRYLLMAREAIARVAEGGAQLSEERRTAWRA